MNVDTKSDVVIPSGHADDGGSYMDWGAIFAGATVATAISFVLMTFASGVGLSAVDASPREGVSLMTLAIAATVWIVAVQVGSFGIGGYLTGRLRRPKADATADEISVRDGAHGLTVWAVAALVGGYLAVSTAGSAVQTTTSTAASAVSAAAGTVADNASEWTSSLTAEDRQAIANIIEKRTGVSPEDAETRLTQLINAPAETTGISKSDVVATANQARFYASMMAFLIAAATLISAVAAWWAAALGGHPRDSNRPLSADYRWRRA